LVNIAKVMWDARMVKERLKFRGQTLIVMKWGGSLDIYYTQYILNCCSAYIHIYFLGWTVSALRKLQTA